MIWTLGDFNSVYLLTGGGPADLTHVLATLGIRYLRLDQVDLSMATIVVRAAAGAAAGVLHDEAAVAMKRSACKVIDRGEAAADRHPGADLDAAADLPHVPVRDLAARTRRSPGKLWPDHPTLQQLRHRVPPAALLPQPLLAADVEFAAHRGRGRRAHAVRRHRARRSRSAACKVRGGRTGDEPRAVHLLHPGRVPRGADVQGDGQLRPAQQPVGADPGDGDDRLAVLRSGC